MIGKILSEKIRDYSPANALEQENILQEILQGYILVSLSRSGFFKRAVFHGGTCLRILYGMNRFSEDLDFILKKPDMKFRWKEYITAIEKDCETEGIKFECQDKSELDIPVKKAFLKTDSIGKILQLILPFKRRDMRKVRIKLEIDCNPPAGSSFETRYIDFPNIAPITTMTPESGFASKSHALLCRDFIKGRDWYDYWWYVSKKTAINYKLLQNALFQIGPWSGEKIGITPQWYRDAISAKIEKIDWKIAREDVRRFLPLQEQENLEHWNRDFFLSLVDRMTEYLEEL
jgi:predicted nucleotidyltransferase component of viral defense system